LLNSEGIEIFHEPVDELFLRSVHTERFRSEALPRRSSGEPPVRGAHRRVDERRARSTARVDIDSRRLILNRSSCER
jgi:hypothetical protein